jgi:ABC-type phosphate transport system auxiliary subunit
LSIERIQDKGAVWIGIKFLQLFESNFSALFQTLNERLQKDVESLNIRLNKMQVNSKLQAETLETLTNEKSTKTHELKVILHNTVYLCMVKSRRL